MAASADPVEVSLTDFHHQPGVFIDSSHQRPVVLTKRKRPYAYVVSPGYFALAEEAIKAMHGNRQVIAAGELSVEDDEFLAKFGPSADEVAADRWQA